MEENAGFRQDPGRIETPAGVVDTARVRRNAAAMTGYAREHGLRWRPHVKTHKSTRVARLEIEAGATGLTVATLREAEAMASVCEDLLLAYPPLGPGPLDRAVALAERVRVAVALDGREALTTLAARAHAAGVRVGVLVEIDAGMRRMGVGEPEGAVELARLAEELDGVEYEGILFYPGHIRMPQAEQTDSLAALRDTLGRFLDALHAAELPPGTVSGGSTPTVWRSHEVDGLTEIRPGTGIFHDRDMLSLGVARPEDLAYAVLATVVSTARPGQAVVDAGSKALAKEELRGAEKGGYGFLLDHPEVVVARVSEEHGVLDLSGTDWRPRIGDRVRVIPNHVCVSVNLHEALWAGEGALEPHAASTHPLEWWPLEGRGRARGTGEPAGMPTGSSY